MSKGWYYEAYRHSLAARGIRTRSPNRFLFLSLAAQPKLSSKQRLELSIFMRDNKELSDAELKKAILNNFPDINEIAVSSYIIPEFRREGKLPIIVEPAGRRQVKLKLDKYDEWIAGHEDLPDDDIAESLMYQFPELPLSYAEDLVKRHKEYKKKSGFAAKELNGTVIDYTGQGIPITMKGRVKEGCVYPVSPEEVKQSFAEFNGAASGITEINFRNPGIPATKQDKAWAQYVRSKQRINIFSQPKVEAKQPGVKKHMLGYVIPHEVAHHHAQYNMKLTEDPEIVEEARADALVARQDPLDKQILGRQIAHRKVLFGPRGSV